MSDARTNILQQLRSAQPGIPASSGTTQVQQASWNPQQRIEQFRQRMESVRAEVHIVTGDSWSGLLKTLVKEKGITSLLYAPETPYGKVISESWRGEPETPLRSFDGSIDSWQQTIFEDIDAAITSTRAAIAETGTLVLWPDMVEPRTFSLVPPVHIALLKASTIYDTFAELVERERWHEGLPTNALLISGPSKSADIEQTLAYGVHGPVELVILVLTEE